MAWPWEWSAACWMGPRPPTRCVGADRVKGLHLACVVFLLRCGPLQALWPASMRRHGVGLHARPGLRDRPDQCDHHCESARKHVPPWQKQAYLVWRRMGGGSNIRAMQGATMNLQLTCLRFHCSPAALRPLASQPTPVPATNGPFVAPPPYPTTVTLDATGSDCAAPACTYKVGHGAAGRLARYVECKPCRR